MQEWTLKLGDQAITVTDAKRLDQDRTVYRLEIEPVNNLPSTVIVKQQKEGWSDEFENEASWYERLKDLQGDKIPIFFGQGDFNGIRALVISEIVGTNLLDLARSINPIDEKKMKDDLEAVFQSLTTYEAIYWDARLDNFMYCDKAAPGASRAMVIDLGQVRFPLPSRPYELNVNNAGARALMEDFRNIREIRDRESRYRYHGRSPVSDWESEPKAKFEVPSEKNSPRTTVLDVTRLSMDSRNIEALHYMAASKAE